MKTLNVWMPEPTFLYLPVYVAVACRIFDKCAESTDWQIKLGVPAEQKDDNGEIVSVDKCVLSKIRSSPGGAGALTIGIADPSIIKDVNDVVIVAPIINGLTIWSIWNTAAEGCLSGYAYPSQLTTVKKIAPAASKKAGFSADPVGNVVYSQELAYLEQHKDKVVLTTNMNSVIKADGYDWLSVKPVEKDASVIMTALICRKNDLNNKEKRAVIKSFVRAILQVKFMLTTSAAVSDMLYDFLSNGGVKEENKKAGRNDLCSSSNKEGYVEEFTAKLGQLYSCAEQGNLFPKDFNINRRIWRLTNEYLGVKIPFKYVDNEVVYEAEADLVDAFGIDIYSLLRVNKSLRRILTIVGSILWWMLLCVPIFLFISSSICWFIKEICPSQYTDSKILILGNSIFVYLTGIISAIPAYKLFKSLIKKL